MQVQTGDDDDGVRELTVEHDVRKALRDGSTDVQIHNGIQSRILTDEAKRPSQGFPKLDAQASSLRFIPEKCPLDVASASARIRTGFTRPGRAAD